MLFRSVTGLTYPTEGTYSLFGRSAASDREKMRRYIGSIIEEPSLYSGYSVLQNLELQRILAGNPDKSVCGKVLDMVELSEAKHKKVRTLSMGMKQRLSIALALTGNPQLLILDVKWSTVLIVYRVYSVQKKRKKERYAQIEPKFVYSVINIKNEEAGGRAYPGSRFLLPKLKKEAQDTCVLLGTAFSDRDGIVLT